MKREQVLLAAVVVILGILAVMRFTGAPSRRVPAGAALTPELPPAEGGQAQASLGARRRRDPLREPREAEPLPPLELPLPPLDDFEAVLPPPVPDSGPDHWSDHLLRRPAPLPGELGDRIGLAADGRDGESGLEGGGSLSEDADYAGLYDSVRLNPITVLHGRLLGEDRYDKRPGDPIRFQEIDPRTGRERFAPRSFAAGEYEGFAFAQTLRNEIELRWRALSPSPAALPERLELVRWLLEHGDREPVAYEHAVRLAEEGARLVGDDVNAWLALGEAWERTFRLDEAFALYARMAGRGGAAGEPDLGLPLEAGRFSRYAAPRVRMAGILRRLGLLEEAQRVLEQAVALGDGDPRALLGLGLLHLDAGRPEAALPLLERAAGMHSSHSSTAALRNGAALGRALLALGEFAEADRVFTETLRAATGRAVAPELAAGRVAALYLSGRFEDAAETARAAVQEYGPEAGLLYLRGIAAGAAGASVDTVVRDLQAAAEAGGLDAALSKAALSFWLGAQGLDEDAALALSDALRLDPGQPYARYLQARRASRQGDLQAAEAGLRSLLGSAPRFAAGLVELGWILHRDGRYGAAEIALRRAAQEQPEWAGAALRRGVNLLAAGDLPAAREALAAAQAAGTGLHAVRNARAWAFNAEGDVAGAIAEFSFTQDVLRESEEDPQFLYAHRWQERLALRARMRRWTDSFAGRLLRPGWEIDARVGVEPRVLDGALVIRGTHREAGLTRVSRELPGLNFVSFAADLRVGAGQRGEAGLQLSLERARRSTWEFRLYRDREGRLRWFVKQGAREQRGESGGLATGVPLRLSVAVDREADPPVLSVTAGGRSIYTGPAPALRSASMPLRAGLFVETPNALPVDAALDDVELVFLARNG